MSTSRSLCAALGVLSFGPLALSQVRLAPQPIGGKFGALTFVGQPPGETRRLFVVEQDGRILVVRDGTTLPTAFLDIAGHASGERRGGSRAVTTGPPPASGTLTGSITWNDAPPRRLDCRRMSPPCSRTMARATVSPSPVPCPVTLVVKNGSKICVVTSGATPGPLSLTSMPTFPAAASCQA